MVGAKKTIVKKLNYSPKPITLCACLKCKTLLVKKNLRLDFAQVTHTIEPLFDLALAEIFHVWNSCVDRACD